MWLARDFLARTRQPVDIPACECPTEFCPPIPEGAHVTTTPTPQQPCSITTILGLIRTYGDLCCDVVGAMEQAGWDDVEEAKAKAAALLDDIASQLHHLEAHNAAS